MSLPRYPTYKDSGVEWLGEVPAHWDVVQFKQLVEIQNGADHKHVEAIDGYPVFGSGGTFSFASDFHYDGESVLLGRKGTIDKPVYVTGRFWTVDTMYWTKIRPGTSGRFVYYAALTIPFDYYSTNTALPSMTKGALSGHLVARPSLSEQAHIAAFLDRETAKIDALVAEQQRLIALLKEKRQAVISHAVTKGLNPNAPMKDSGVEWLREVPAHWQVRPLKYLISLTSGGTPSKANPSYWDGTVPWASSKDLKSEELFDTQDHTTQQALDEGAATLVPAGSILTVVRGMILLHTFPVAVVRVPMAINQDLKAISPSAGVDSTYLAWLLRGASNEVLGRTDEAGHGTKVLRLEVWLAMQVPVPPLSEQAVLVEHIVEQRFKLDLLIDEAQRAIDLLQERRTALISAAVTGQIDVRPAAERTAA
jgi:type I restriction enzyme S subunit